MRKRKKIVNLCEEEEEDSEFMLRQEEEVQFSAYDRNKKVDKNIAFLVTNDIVESPFIRSLNKMCKIVEEEKEDQIIDSEEYQKIKDKDDAKEYMALQKTEFKNTLYSFHEDSGKKYQINFVFHEKDVPLGLFSDVEWIFTYYKPKQSGNIIIDTFANAIFNLLMHIRDLKPIRGKLSLHTCLSKSKCDVIAQKPEARILFHKPGTNLYYLQSHYYEDPNGLDLGIQDICITPQMTFSAHISNIIPIMKHMIHDSIRSIPSNTETLKNRLEILNRIEHLVNLLLTNYNETEAARSSTFVFLQNTPEKKEEYKIIKSYLFLIFYKLFLFYENYHNNTAIQYFKNSLFLNSRHSNYVLYDALKKSIRRYFALHSTNSLTIENEIPIIIQKISVQQEILEKHFVSDIKSLRKNTFRPSNQFDKKNPSYGNPAKSLISYFQFFEDPISDDTNMDIEDNILYYDYLEYKRIDAHSAKMDLKSDIILVELRVFTRLLSSYIYSILDTDQKKKMTDGICNRMTKNFQPDVKGISLSVLLDFYRHYHKNPKTKSKLKSKTKTRSKTRSKSKSRSKSRSKPQTTNQQKMKN